MGNWLRTQRCRRSAWITVETLRTQTSEEDQLSTCRAAAECAGFEVVGEYFDECLVPTWKRRRVDLRSPDALRGDGLDVNRWRSRPSRRIR
jgi:hypothetical protein